MGPLGAGLVTGLGGAEALPWTPSVRRPLPARPGAGADGDRTPPEDADGAEGAEGAASSIPLAAVAGDALAEEPFPGWRVAAGPRPAEACGRGLGPEKTTTIKAATSTPTVVTAATPASDAIRRGVLSVRVNANSLVLILTTAASLSPTDASKAPSGQLSCEPDCGSPPSLGSRPDEDGAPRVPCRWCKAAGFQKPSGLLKVAERQMGRTGDSAVANWPPALWPRASGPS
jgi:hypothetical protein